MSAPRRAFRDLRRVCAPGLLTLLVLPAHAWGGTNWWSSVGPDRGTIYSLAIDPASPNVLYAGGFGGVSKSLDGGAGWLFARSGMANSQVFALAIDPKTTTTLYAGTKSFGVFKTTNGASTWSQVNTGLPTAKIFALAVDPSTPSIVYAGTDSGVFKSSNGGSSWSAATSGVGSLPVFALVVDPKTPSTLYAGTKNAGVFKSTDAGASWTAATNGLAFLLVYTLAVDPKSPSTLYAGTVGAVFKSTDGAASWTATGLTAGPVYWLAIDPVTTSTVYAGLGPIGVSKSVDGGRSWLPASNGLPPAPSALADASFVDALVIDPTSPGTIYAGTQDGIWKSANGAGSWSISNNGLAALRVFAVAVDPSAPSTVYAGTDLGLFRSVDGAASWSRIASGPGETPVYALLALPGPPATLFAGYDGGASMSTDGGSTWTAVPVGLATTLAFAAAPGAPSTLYAGGFSGSGQTQGAVAQSTDGGSTWTSFGVSPVALPTVNALAVDPTSSTTVYAGTDAGGYKTIFDSVGNKLRWFTNTALAARRVLAVLIDPVSATTVYAGTDGGLFKSVDGGVSWTGITNGLNATRVTALTLDQGSSTFYAGSNGGVFKSTDGGASWAAMNQGLRNTVANAVAIAPGSPGALYAGTNGSSVFQLGSPAACNAGPETLCLSGGRFRVLVAWRAVSQGTSGAGQAVSLTSDTGYFWFFQSTNVELVIKVLDARGINGNFWVFYGALSNVEYTITVVDSVTGETKTYVNPQNTLASVADTAAFPLGEAAALEAASARLAPPRARRESDGSLGDFSVRPEFIAACVAGQTALCLSGARFRVEVAWRAVAQGTSGAGQAVALTSDTGYFWFFQSTNVELIVKVLDARGVNGKFWVFYGALSNVEYTITVTDTQTAAVKTYFNPQDTLASRADTSAF
jgi:photosystem II stability/assembly factor-like uncharacterized protein